MLHRSIKDGSFFVAVMIITLWVLSRPFAGITGDATIYIGRALADLDPNGVGRDLMFVHDGQSQFSLFGLLIDRLLPIFGVGGTRLVFAALNLGVWFTAMTILARRLTKEHAFLILAFVALLPPFYGPYALLRFGEQIAVPRPLAEACVLAALAALIGKRDMLALALLALGGLLHPIMVMPGLLAFSIFLCARDRRWIVAILALGLAIFVAALLGLPLFNRLTQTVDPQWRMLLETRNIYLFVSRWPIETYATVAAQMATLLIAADLTRGRVGLLFLATAGVGLIGLAVSWIGGDLLGSVLILQAQLWRSLWLVSALAAVALAVCTMGLWRQGPIAWVSLAFLAFGWIYAGDAIAPFCGATASLGLYIALKSGRFSIRPAPALVGVAVLLLMGLAWKAEQIVGFLQFVATAPPQVHIGYHMLWDIHALSVVIAIAVAGLTLNGTFRPKPPLLAAASVGFLALTACVWDTRSLYQKRIDEAADQPALSALTAGRPGPVFWIDGLEPWYWLHRPHWGHRIQGAGIVFARDFGLQWEARMTFLTELGLADPNLLAPWSTPMRLGLVEVTPESRDRLCSRPDAPSWIIAPLESGVEPAAGLNAKIWTAPVPLYQFAQADGETVWHEIDRYAVIACAGT